MFCDLLLIALKLCRVPNTYSIKLNIVRTMQKANLGPQVPFYTPLVAYHLCLASSVGLRVYQHLGLPPESFPFVLSAFAVLIIFILIFIWVKGIL